MLCISNFARLKAHRAVTLGECYDVDNETPSMRESIRFSGAYHTSQLMCTPIEKSNLSRVKGDLNISQKGKES